MSRDSENVKRQSGASKNYTRTATRRDKNRYGDMALRTETVARIGDNRKLFPVSPSSQDNYSSRRDQ